MRVLGHRRVDNDSEGPTCRDAKDLRRRLSCSNQSRSISGELRWEGLLDSARRYNLNEKNTWQRYNEVAGILGGGKDAEEVPVLLE